MRQEPLDSHVRDFIARVESGDTRITLTEMRDFGASWVIQRYGEYMYPGIRELELDVPVVVKRELRGMGCDGGFEPIPPQRIELDESLTLRERLIALARAALQFYAFSGPAELARPGTSYTRWGFLHLDQSGAPTTRYLGLHQDMTAYLTEQSCDALQWGVPTWVQRGNADHIRQLIAIPAIGESLLLRAYFGEAFPDLVEAVNCDDPGRWERLSDCSDEVDNGRLCEFPADTIKREEERFTSEVLRIAS